ncbi:MAG TPA: hypothetical protein VEZ44_09455 [bacterium]|nr:hypothetical protein [bacterium]
MSTALGSLSGRTREIRAAARPGAAPARTRENGAGDPREALLELYNLQDEPPPPDRTVFPGVDPWRWQYFEGVACPASVEIPIDDPAAWRLFPRYRHVHDKLFICESQGIAHAPHGVAPARFPVFSKPILNMHGMGAGGFVIRSGAELDARFTPGHLWMTLFRGRHISTDVALVRGAPRWWSHTEGKRLPGGTFDYWSVLARRLPRLEAYCGRWIRRHLRGFTGIVNFESIGGAIIECHLRMSEQWIDLNGPGWLESVVDLYAHGRWRFDARPRRGYSIVLFGAHGQRYWIDPGVVRALRAVAGVSSIQITFDLRKPLEQHAMPPGGFRLAIVNCWDLATGQAVRARLAREFVVLGQNGHGPTNGTAPASSRRPR